MRVGKLKRLIHAVTSSVVGSIVGSIVGSVAVEWHQSLRGVGTWRRTRAGKVSRRQTDVFHEVVIISYRETSQDVSRHTSTARPRPRGDAATHVGPRGVNVRGANHHGNGRVAEQGIHGGGRRRCGKELLVLAAAAAGMHVIAAAAA